jgi:hypothetical protein
MDALLAELLPFLGWAAIALPSKDWLHWGAAPTLLQLLADLPFRYFSVDTYRDRLFPTLCCAIHGSATNLEVLKGQINAALLKDYLESTLRKAADGSVEGSHASLNRVSKVERPTEFWRECLAVCAP